MKKPMIPVTAVWSGNATTIPPMLYNLVLSAVIPSDLMLIVDGDKDLASIPQYKQIFSYLEDLGINLMVAKNRDDLSTARLKGALGSEKFVTKDWIFMIDDNILFESNVLEKLWDMAKNPGNDKYKYFLPTVYMPMNIPTKHTPASHVKEYLDEETVLDLCRKLEKNNPTCWQWYRTKIRGLMFEVSVGEGCVLFKKDDTILTASIAQDPEDEIKMLTNYLGKGIVNKELNAYRFAG